MIVVEISSNPKALKVSLVQDTCHFTGALNAHLLPALNRREKQNLNQHVRSYRRACAAVNESSVNRNIGCKATSGALASSVPVEDDRELKLVSHGSSPVPIKRNNIRAFGKILH
jgi:hypothetical protein